MNVHEDVDHIVIPPHQTTVRQYIMLVQQPAPVTLWGMQMRLFYGLEFLDKLFVHHVTRCCFESYLDLADLQESRLLW